MTNEKVQAILSGKSQVRYGANIRAVACYLGASQKSSALDKTDKRFKQEETERLKAYINSRCFWTKDVELDKYVSEGAEQKVYLKDGRSVIKLNDAIYYLSWTDYFISLLLNNYFFPDTAYKLLGFFEHETTVYAVVEQSFIKATEPTDLKRGEQFMTSNGFQRIRNNDYFNPQLGIFLEDLHDENVLTSNGILYFIDTVFYLQGDLTPVALQEGVQGTRYHGLRL
ncbi:MAG: hypothetical protein LBB90_07810 [Tannerella sp.]|jgi:hypothetical protein|nr:hypothetical protein [Tannerella sp.]